MKHLVLIGLIYGPMAHAAPLDLPYTGVSIYAMPWNMTLMNNESPSKIRDLARIKTTSSYDLFVNGLANKLKIESVKASSTPVKGSFTLYAVLDFFSGNRRITLLSDGSQLCTEDLKHCIDVDENFKRRIDPSYN